MSVTVTFIDAWGTLEKSNNGTFANVRILPDILNLMLMLSRFWSIGLYKKQSSFPEKRMDVYVRDKWRGL
jgi:hypothetical protein